MSDYTHGEYVVSAGQGRYYIPTTEEIRLRYSDSRHWGEELDAQFDRWLAEVKAEAWNEGVAACINETGMQNPYRQGEVK